MNLLINYLNLNTPQRHGLICLIVLALISLTYSKPILNHWQKIARAKIVLQQHQEKLIKQKNIIAQTSSIKQQIAHLNNKLSISNDDEFIIQSAKEAEINDIKWDAREEQPVDVSLSCDWSKFLTFINLLANKPSALKINQITIKQNMQQLYIDLLISGLNSQNAKISNLATNNNEEQIEINEIKWLGSLEKMGEFFAFLQAPNGRVIGLSPGQSFGKSHWKVSSIQAKKVYLLDTDSKKIIIKDLP